MSIVSISDIAKCAKFTFDVYQYGFARIYNANTQYIEFGRSVHALYKNLRQLQVIFDEVKNIPPCPIPGSSSFYDTRDLNEILDDPYRTVEECAKLLRRRDCFGEEGGFISNITWHAFIEPEVALLHNKVMFHNIKITALLKPLELKLLIDIQSLVVRYGDTMLKELGEIKDLIRGASQAIVPQEDVRCHHIVIPPYLIRKFENLSIDANPKARSDSTFPMHDGINAFLRHYEDEVAAAEQSHLRGIQPASVTQWPIQYVRMMRSIWIIQRVISSAEYVKSCARGNQLLIYFVEDLEKKCIYMFNQHSDRPANPRRVVNEPDEVTLDLLGEEVFMIWPIVVPAFDRPHETEMDDMKTILRTPLFSREINLLSVTLSPIYADPQNKTSGMDIGLYTSGMPTHDNLLSFQTYEALYSFQEAITGFRVVDDIVDVDVIVMADKPTHYKARVQIWNFAPNLPAQTPLPSIYGNSSPATSAATIRPPSNSNSSMSTVRRLPSNDSSARLSSPRKSSFFSSKSSYLPSKASSFSMRSTATAISEVTSLSDPRDSNTEAFIFESLREPLLVLILRPENPPPSRKSRGETSDCDGGLTLLKIPIGSLNAVLDKRNCSCQKGGTPCRHTSIMGPPKRFGTAPLMAEWRKGKMVNLAALGAHYDDGRGGGEKEKLNHVKMTFQGENGRERKKKFEKTVAGVQEVDRRKRYVLEEEKVALRFRNWR
ncbi:hypothetical protein V498_02838 [Pseudogymnoascus sp. VKM F-4517 (FW-2822)]|nr:hypothetical protein V498_02838 [Pseudogymnoascus sp. VKM F-4517 (FW-2822)]